MRAVIRRNKQLICDEVPDLTPGPGQILCAPWPAESAARISTPSTTWST